MADKDDALGQHQQQCDYRYVQWMWLAGILVTMALAGGGVGWAANGAIHEVRESVRMVADSVMEHETRNVAERLRMQNELDELKARTATLDTLKRWMPRVEGKVDEIQRMVRSK